jgi:hypothetical protein
VLSAAFVQVPEALPPPGADSAFLSATSPKGALAEAHDLAVPHTEPASHSKVDYALAASLDTANHSILARGTITLTNRSSRTLDELWFHLYMNAFLHSETAFLRGNSGSSERSRSRRQLRRPGGITVRKLASSHAPNQDLWANASAHSPGDPNDRTDIRVPLTHPIQSGETHVFLVEFETILPEIVERTGFAEDYHFVAQWYPKVARLDPSGAFRHFAFQAQAEFAANFGDYQIELSVPANYHVGHTGRETRSSVENGNLSVSVELAQAHDFAWTAWPDFVEERRNLVGVDVCLLRPKGTEHLAQDTWQTLQSALPDYQHRFGDYPYTTLTVVHPPEFASASGGMEYPSLITTGGSPWLLLFGAQWNAAVTAHELAHQWFYGSIASDEYQEPFLDESLTTWAESTFLEARFGDGATFSSPWLTLSAWGALRHQAFFGNSPQSALLPASQYPSFNTLAASIYGRAPLALETIRRVRGSAAFDGAIRNYTTRFRFRHPNKADFFSSLEADIGKASVGELIQLLEGETCGYRLGKVETRGHDGSYSSTIAVGLEGAVALPTELEMKFSDGTMRQIAIHGPQDVQFEHPSPLVSVQIDIKRSILLDPRLSNNQWRAPPAYQHDKQVWTTLFTRLLSEVALWSIF